MYWLCAHNIIVVGFCVIFFGSYLSVPPAHPPTYLIDNEYLFMDFVQILHTYSFGEEWFRIINPL